MCNAPYTPKQAHRAGFYQGVCFGIAIGLPQTLFLIDRQIFHILALWLTGLAINYVVFAWRAQRFTSAWTSNMVSMTSMMMLMLTAVAASAGTESTFAAPVDSNPILDAVTGVLMYLFFSLFFSLGNMLAGLIGRFIAARRRRERAV